jgi:hypothetical protein
MDLEASTPDSGGESTLDRLEALLSADDAPQEPSTPPSEAKQADEPATDDPEKADADDKDDETPNEYQLADVAKLLGADEGLLEVDEDGSITVKTKIDGQEGKVKFADLIKGHQLQGHVDKQVREAADVRKQAQEYAQAVQQQTQAQHAVVEKIVEAKAIESQLAQYQGINWSALEDSDPVKAMRLQRQFGELKQAYQAKVQDINQTQSQIQQQQSQHTAASLETERQALAKACPEWNSEAVATKEKQQIAADLKARGYTDRDIQGLSDHKAVLLARDAMLYRQMKAANTTAEKQVRQAPKIVKPGSTSQTNQRTTIQKLHQEVRRTGSRQSVADYLLATGKV